MAQTFRLVNPYVRANAKAAIDSLPDGWWVKLYEGDKSRDQEEKYHAMISDIAKAMVGEDGRVDADSWKRLLVDQFKADTLNDDDIGPYWKSNPLNIVPSLDRQRLVTLGEQTRKFPKKVAMAFITWLDAWAIEHDVSLSA